jgi:hypothetical protein
VAAEVDGGRAHVARGAEIGRVVTRAGLGSAGIGTATAVLGAAVHEDGTEDGVEASGGGQVSNGGAKAFKVEMEGLGMIV